MAQKGIPNVWRPAVSAATLVLLFAGLATAKPVVVVSEVNLRKAPGTNSAIITLIPKGAAVEVGTCTNGWCRVSWNGLDGFSIAANLGLAPRPVRRPADVGGSTPAPPDTQLSPREQIIGFFQRLLGQSAHGNNAGSAPSPSATLNPATIAPKNDVAAVAQGHRPNNSIPLAAPEITGTPPMAAQPIPTPQPPPTLTLASVVPGNEVAASAPELTVTVGRAAAGSDARFSVRVHSTILPSDRELDVRDVEIRLHQDSMATSQRVTLPAVFTDELARLRVSAQLLDAAGVVLGHAEATLQVIDLERNVFQAIQSAQDRNDASARYLDAYPSGRFRQKVLDNIEPVLFAQASEKCSLDALAQYERFVVRYDGRYEQRISAIRQDREEAQKATRYREARAYLAKFPDSPCAEGVKQLTTVEYWSARHDPASLMEMADLYDSLRETRLKVEVLRQAASQQYVPAMVQLGIALISQGDQADGETLLKRVAERPAIGADKVSVVLAAQELGILEHRRNNDTAALGWQTEAINDDPTCARCYLERGKARLLLNQPSDAKADFQKANALAKDIPGRWSDVGEQAGMYLKQIGP
jgi:tetratricopeptide (TPR) repeat protein